jgi:hypothetical protein
MDFCHFNRFEHDVRAAMEDKKLATAQKALLAKE